MSSGAERAQGGEEGVLDPVLWRAIRAQLFATRDVIQGLPEFAPLDPKNDYFLTGSIPDNPKQPLEFTKDGVRYTVFYDETDTPGGLAAGDDSAGDSVSLHACRQITERLNLADDRGNGMEIFAGVVIIPVGLPDQGEIVNGTERSSITVRRGVQ